MFEAEHDSHRGVYEIIEIGFIRRRKIGHGDDRHPVFWSQQNQRLETNIVIDDDSDMGSKFPSSQKGSYDLRVRVRAKARK